MPSPPVAAHAENPVAGDRRSPHDRHSIRTNPVSPRDLAKHRAMQETETLHKLTDDLDESIFPKVRTRWRWFGVEPKRSPAPLRQASKEFVQGASSGAIQETVDKEADLSRIQSRHCEPRSARRNGTPGPPGELSSHRPSRPPDRSRSPRLPPSRPRPRSQGNADEQAEVMAEDEDEEDPDENDKYKFPYVGEIEYRFPVVPPLDEDDPNWLEQMMAQLRQERHIVENHLEDSRVFVNNVLGEFTAAKIVLENERTEMKELMDTVREMAGDAFVQFLYRAMDEGKGDLSDESDSEVDEEANTNLPQDSEHRGRSVAFPRASPNKRSREDDDEDEARPPKVREVYKRRRLEINALLQSSKLTSNQPAAAISDPISEVRPREPPTASHFLPPLVPSPSIPPPSAAPEGNKDSHIQRAQPFLFGINPQLNGVAPSASRGGSEDPVVDNYIDGIFPYQPLSPPVRYADPLATAGPADVALNDYNAPGHEIRHRVLPGHLCGIGEFGDPELVLNDPRDRGRGPPRDSAEGWARQRQYEEDLENGMVDGIRTERTPYSAPRS